MKDGNKQYLVKHDRTQCIGCHACVSICSKFWEMNGEDNMADLVGGDKKPDGSMQLEITEEDFKCNMNAAESCPVNIIHINNKESGEELI